MGVNPQPPPRRRRPIAAPPPPQPIKTWKCPHCESLVDKDKERCFNCGAPRVGRTNSSRFVDRPDPPCRKVRG